MSVIIFLRKKNTIFANGITDTTLYETTDLQQMKIAVFCGSSNPKNTKYVDDAKLLGRKIAESGHTLIYGGSNLGMMGAVSGAAASLRINLEVI